jgi:L-ascorbate metabolism protein UlaG (beta-lactamase superfamily)
VASDGDDDAEGDDADGGARPGLRLTHVGGPTLLVEVGGWRILTDPTFDAPGDRYAFGWGTGSTKLVGPALMAEDLGRVDAILLTHDHHADNLDGAGRALLEDVPIVVTTRAGAARLDGSARGLAPWGSTRLEAPGRLPIDVVATPCRHGPPLSRPIVGQVVGFGLTWAGQEHGALWISGDTVLHRDLWTVPDRLDVAVAVLHLGGVRFPITGPVRYTMTIDDAVALCERLRPRTAIPVHYEGWSHFQQGREAIERRLASAPPAISDAFRFLPRGAPTDIAT